VEAGIILAGLLLLAFPGSGPLSQLLVGCYFLDLALMLLPDLLRYSLMAGSAVARRLRCCGAGAPAAAAGAQR
jgi:hypothetical protein